MFVSFRWKKKTTVLFDYQLSLIVENFELNKRKRLNSFQPYFNQSLISLNCAFYLRLSIMTIDT